MEDKMNFPDEVLHNGKRYIHESRVPISCGGTMEDVEMTEEDKIYKEDREFVLSCNAAKPTHRFVHPYNSHDTTCECGAEDSSKCVLTSGSEELKYENEIETLRIQLAGCGVAAMQNTESSVKARITAESPGWSASYGDVCRAVDREMQLRQRVDELEAKLALTSGGTMEDTNDWCRSCFVLNPCGNAIKRRDEAVLTSGSAEIECPWPESMWSMTDKEYAAAIPDEKLRTAISGYLMRAGWEIFKKQALREMEDNDPAESIRLNAEVMALNQELNRYRAALEEIQVETYEVETEQRCAKALKEVGHE
jgi:hypothetical protein